MTFSSGVRSISRMMLCIEPSLRAQLRRAMPLFTSQNSISRMWRALSSLPSITMPKPPLITSPQPTPPPLCSDTHVAPRNESPITFCTAMSAQNCEPSYMLLVSRNGESVPDTSWWSRPSTTGRLISPQGGKAAALTDSQLGDLGEALVNATYSQKQERAADDYGYEFLKKAGKNPWAMALSFQKLKKLQEEAGAQKSSKLNQLFSTHPDLDARIQRMEERATSEGIEKPANTMEETAK